MQLSVAIRKASLCNGQWLTQRHLVKVQRTSVCGVLNHKWNIYITSLPKKAQKSVQRGKNLKVEGGWGKRVSSGLDRIIRLIELTAAVAASPS